MFNNIIAIKYAEEHKIPFEEAVDIVCDSQLKIQNLYDSVFRAAARDRSIIINLKADISIIETSIKLQERELEKDIKYRVAAIIKKNIYRNGLKIERLSNRVKRYEDDLNKLEQYIKILSLRVSDKVIGDYTQKISERISKSLIKKPKIVQSRTLKEDEICFRFTADCNICRLNEIHREISLLLVDLEAATDRGKEIRIKNRINELEKERENVKKRFSTPNELVLLGMLNRYAMRRRYNRNLRPKEILYSRRSAYIVVDNSKNMFDWCILMDCDYDYCTPIHGVIPSGLSLIDKDANPIYSIKLTKRELYEQERF